jgi:hypothetical protein
MLIEWSHDELATSLSAATVERHLEFVDLLEEMRAGRVRYFWCDGAAFCLMVQTALESASFPVPVPLLHQYARATARGDIPALFVITVYEDAVGHPGVHALRSLYVLWNAAQGLGIYQQPAREGETATPHEVWARDLRDCLEQIFDGAWPAESAV